jgi:hypothetical protein
MYFQVAPQAEFIMFDFLSLTLDLSKTNFRFTKIFKIRKTKYNLYWAPQILEDPLLWLIIFKIKKEISLFYIRKGFAMGAFWTFGLFWPINFGDLKFKRPP